MALRGLICCLLLVVTVSSEPSGSEMELLNLEEVLHKYQPEALEALEELKKEQIHQASADCRFKIVQKIVSTCGDLVDCKSMLLPALACQFKLNEKVFIELCCPTKL